MTACAEIKSNIILSELYKQTGLSDFIKYVEHGDNNYKGFAKKNTKKKRKEKVKKTFFNQVTLHCFYDDKINTAKFYFDKVFPRVEQHYKSAISGSSNIMNFKFN